MAHGRRGERESFQRAFAFRHNLRPIGLVTKMWNEQSGEKPITRGRVLQVLKVAEAKLAAALAREVLGGRAE